jgi:hypothetical protein
VPRKRAKGRSSTLRRHLRKQTNVIDAKRVRCSATLTELQRERVSLCLCVYVCMCVYVRVGVSEQGRQTMAAMRGTW